ncbi:MAG: tetratricopeptide repeat protein [Planctomycetaceae bacterium]
MASSQRRLLDQADLHLRAGRVKRAKALYQQILRQDQKCSEALFAIALLLYDAGELEAAAERLRQLLNLRPELAEAHFNLGTILNALGQLESASEAFTRAIELQPSFADAHNNLGIVYREQGHPEQALACFQEAVRCAPDSLAAMLNYGTALLKSQQIDKAVEVCHQNLAGHPESPDAHYALGIALEQAGQSSAALQYLREAVRLRPEVAEWQFHLAACEGSVSPSSAPAEYVASLFDAYAARFDEHLVGQLGYRTPQHLREAVQQLTNRHFKRALDLGCGTGLCGEVFKSIVECLVGVDLSSQMVSAARQRGIYHDLKVSDIGTFLDDEVVESDLVLAADVFVYIGDLSDTFVRVSRILRTGGLFAFSVEANSGDTWQLGSTRRFSHGLPYLQQLAKLHNLTQRAVSSVVLRTDGGKEVSGWIMVLEKLP